MNSLNPFYRDLDHYLTKEPVEEPRIRIVTELHYMLYIDGELLGGYNTEQQAIDAAEAFTSMPWNKRKS